MIRINSINNILVVFDDIKNEGKLYIDKSWITVRSFCKNGVTQIKTTPSVEFLNSNVEHVIFKFFDLMLENKNEQ